MDSYRRDGGGAVRSTRASSSSERRRCDMSERRRRAEATVTTPGRARDPRRAHLRRAARARLRAYTDPELIPQWWGPRGTTTVVERAGRQDRRRLALRQRGRGRQETAFRGVFREVTPPSGSSGPSNGRGCPGYVSVETRRLRGPRRRPHQVVTDIDLPHRRSATACSTPAWSGG